MATDTAVAPSPLSPVVPTAVRPPAAPPDPTRHLWQLPVLVLGVGVFVAAWQGWLPIPGEGRESGFPDDLIKLKAAYEKAAPDTAVLKDCLTRVAGKVDEAPPRDQALARFYLGSGYVRLAELTPDLDESRGYWTLAQQHFARVTEKELRDPNDAARYAYRFNKARAALEPPPETPREELQLLINILSSPQPGEELGETLRLIADLSMRLNPPDLTRAKLALATYVQSGIATPPAALARGRLKLGRVYLQLQDYELARRTLEDIGEDAPPDVLGPAKMDLARVYMADSSWDEAARALEKVRAAPKVAPELHLAAAYQLGLCKLRARKPDEAARMFEEAAKAPGQEGRAAEIQLADLYLRSTDPARHRAAVDLLAKALVTASAPGTYDSTLVRLNDVQATFELAVSVLLNDRAYEPALRAAVLYKKVAAPGRDLEKQAEVNGAWGFALKETGGDARSKFEAAAADLAALVAYQPRTDGKLDALRRSASFYRLAANHREAARRLEEAVALPNIPEKLLPTVWIELADAFLAANRFDDVWKILRKVLAQESEIATATRYRLARQFVDSRHPDFVRLGRELFTQIANQQNVKPPEREYHERAITELANALIREGKFADAETRLRAQLGLYPNGAEAGLARLLLGVCLLQRAAAPGVSADDATKMRTEALGLFKRNAADCAQFARTRPLTEREAWLKRQSELRILQAYQQLRTPRSARDLLTEAGAMLDSYAGTIEELIILSLMYHAFRQLNAGREALEIRERMKTAFDKLPLSAFSKQPGEYSRDYWLNVWFSK
jgi:tetratricopeptide (TPR) repeat protein